MSDQKTAILDLVDIRYHLLGRADNGPIPLESFVTQGTAWERPMRIYITVIPLSGDEPGIAEQITFGPSERLV